MAGKFQIKSRTWNLITAIGSAILLVVGFGGLFVLQASDSGATAVFVFVALLGLLTLLLFCGPGAVYPARKRIKAIKSALPGGTLAWIRSHLYLPILALVAAFVHATSVPYRSLLTSGKVLLLVGILVAIAGWCRHHLIGLQKTALNVDITISKIVDGQPRRFRQLAADLVEGRRPVQDIEADVAQLGPEQQQVWTQVRELSDKVSRHFPRAGGQSRTVRQYKLLRALHAPLTIVLFVLLGYHLWDVFGVTQQAVGDEKDEIAAAETCAGCHDEIHDDWERSSMAHAQTSTIMEAQLPVTLAENAQLAADLGEEQQAIFDSSAKTCVNCHAPVGSQFTDQIDALLPLDEGSENRDAAVGGGNASVQSDGVGCVTCHSQELAPAERAGFGALPIERAGALSYGTFYGPLFDDPNPLPTRAHEVDDNEVMWNDPVRSSELCGACHNVAVDIDGDGLSPVPGAEQGLDGDAALSDEDGDFILDQNEIDLDENGVAEDLILQTTYDEWQDYIVSFDERIGQGTPLGCSGCHMPTEGDGEQGVVDVAPGLMPVPDRQARTHTFVGVDYDLDPEAYDSQEDFDRSIAERAALLGSAVTLQVENDDDEVFGDTFGSTVTVSNNLLAHNFPTGFAFARQFWLEVTAETADGEEVCLVDDLGIDGDCGSGVIESDAEDLPQCDIFGAEGFTNSNVEMQGTQEECDPWLANFQKILTDGDPDGDGVFTEVSYQSFLGGIVQDRFRVEDDLQMAALNPTRQNDAGEDQTSIDIPYVFDTSEIADGEEITVTARLRFRHLPPYFIRDLAERQEGIDMPDSARIEDPDELIGNLIVTDVVTAASGQGAQLACPGPQNDPSASILDCLG